MVQKPIESLAGLIFFSLFSNLFVKKVVQDLTSGGDDWLSLDCVEYMMKLINETGSTMAFSDKVFTSREQVQIEHDHIETWTAEEATAAIIYPHMAIGPWNKIYSLKLLRDNNISFSVPWFGEGLYFAATAAQHANHVGVGHG